MAAIRLVLLAVALAGPREHPMHTAVAELVQQDARGAIIVEVRVFADDFRAAIALPSEPAAADSAMARYLRGTFALADRTGRPVRVIWAGAERSGDVILLRLRAEVPGGLAGARVTSLVLCERFEDEVNVVRAAYGRRTETLLFLRGDSSKALP
jgi:hypothetical protein